MSTHPKVKVPLTEDLIAAAVELSDRYRGWQTASAVFELLHTRIPEFSVEAITLKILAINHFAATNLYAVDQMAEHIAAISEDSVSDADPQLVDEIAILTTKDGKERHNTSLASKFAHFFIDRERFPIYDSLAEKVLKLHFASGVVKLAPKSRYQQFFTLVESLIEMSEIQTSFSALDRYLWLAGKYLEWKKQESFGNSELRELFASADAQEFGGMIEEVLILS